MAGDNTGLGDLLSGFGGNPVNRPALNAAVMQGQAMAGLRTAQTEEALEKAQMAREENQAGEELESALGGLQGPDGKPMLSPSQVHMTATQMKFLHGGSKEALEGLKQAMTVGAGTTMLDPNANPNQRTRADQFLNPNANPYQVSSTGELIPRMQNDVDNPHVIQTPGSLATEGGKDANAAWRRDQVANPQKYHPNGVDLSAYPELATAVNEHRLDPLRINSRNVSTLAQLAQGNPTLNFDAEHSEAVLQSNATFRQRAMTVEALPGLMDSVVAAGKKLGYNDAQVVGMFEAWKNGQTNDANFIEYMSQRNDVLLKLASVMRGVGMSDQSHTAEQEAMHPTLSPRALDAWERGQMASVMPLIKQQSRFSHRGETTQQDPRPPSGAAPGVAPPHTQPTPVASAPGAAPATSTPDVMALARAEQLRRQQAAAGQGGASPAPGAPQ